MKKPFLLFAAAGLSLLAGSLLTAYHSSGTVTEDYLTLQERSSRELRGLYDRLSPTRVYGLSGVAFTGKGMGGMAFDGMSINEQNGYSAASSFPARLFIKAKALQCFSELHGRRMEQIQMLRGLYEQQTSSLAEIRAFLDATSSTDALEMACRNINNAKSDSQYKSIESAVEAPAEPEPEAAPSLPAKKLKSVWPPLRVPDPAACAAPAINATFSAYTAEGVTLEYPSSLATKVSKSANGTVYQFASPDHCLQINIHRYFNTMETDAAGLLAKEVDAHSGVTYKFKKGDSFVLAGAENGWGYYKRGVMYGQSKYYVTDVEVLVPEAQVKQYSDLISHISLSLKVTGDPTEPEYVESGVDWHATRNTSRDFHRIYVKSRERELEADYLSDALPANCLQGIKEDMQERGADYAYCVQSYRDNVEAREKTRWGL